jgi:hypothetical protein
VRAGACHIRRTRVDAGALGDLGEPGFVESGEPLRSDRFGRHAGHRLPRLAHDSEDEFGARPLAELDPPEIPQVTDPKRRRRRAQSSAVNLLGIRNNDTRRQ